MGGETVGVDIAQLHFDVHSYPGGGSGRFENTDKGRRSFVKWLKSRQSVMVVFEPTGPYHKALEADLHKAGIALAKVNPLHARRFAEATGCLNKTDRVDAAILARMAAVLQIKAQPERPENLTGLTELLSARRGLMKERTANLNRQKNLVHPLLKRQCSARIRQIEGQVQMIERELRAAVAADAALTQKFEILISIPGISATTAFTLLADLPELGELTSAQAGSLAGLAPMHRESGNWKGQSRIRGGRAVLRQSLYMPALVATRFNPDLRVVYKRLVDAGKPAKIAITAVMRKLVILANTLVASGRIWELRPMK